MHKNPISWKNFFCPQNWENGPKMSKIGFFEFKEKFGHIKVRCLFYIEYFCLLCSYTNPLGKSCSWDISQNPFSQSDCRISKRTIFPEKIDETVSFLACWYGQSGHLTLKLNQPVELTYFLHAGTVSGKLVCKF